LAFLLSAIFESHASSYLQKTYRQIRHSLRGNMTLQGSLSFYLKQASCYSEASLVLLESKPLPSQGQGFLIFLANKNHKSLDGTESTACVPCTPKFQQPPTAALLGCG